MPTTGRSFWGDRERYVYTSDLVATAAFRSSAKRLVRADPAAVAAVIVAASDSPAEDAPRQVNALTAVLVDQPELLDLWMDDGRDAFAAALREWIAATLSAAGRGEAQR